MPRLPNAADLGERPDVRPAGGIASYQATSGKETAPGLAMAKAGGAVSGVGDDFFKLVKEEERRVNTTRAEEAFNGLRQRQLDLTIGEKDGFVHKKGGDAINRPLLKDYTDRLSTISTEIEGQLANDEQRELFRKRAGVSSLQFQEDLMRHIAREGDVHAKQAYDGGVNVELRTATARWEDPNAVALSLERINGLVEQEAARAGWAPETKQAELLKRTSAVHSSVIGQALATDNYVFAQKWYEANRAEIDPSTAKAVQKAVEDGAQKQAYAGYTREYLGVQNDRGGLSDLEKRVTADSSLDDTRKNALLGRILSRGETLERRADVENQKVLRRVERAVGDVRANLMAGFEPTPEQLIPILNASKGTELEPEVKGLIQASNATRTFRNSLPAAQEVMLTQAEAAIRQDPGKFDRNLLSAWRSIHENQKRRVQESPVSYAVQQGLVDPASPAAKPLDLSSPVQAVEGLSARMELSRAMARNYGGPVKPLTPEEVGLATNMLKAATVPQKREWLGNLAQAMNGDAQGYSAIMGQIAQDAPVLAIAGEYAGKGRTQASDLLLRGESILRPNRKEDGSPDGGKLLPMPAEKDMRRIYDDKIRDAYAGMPQARSDHFQASRAIYAALASDAGDRDTSVLDTDRWEHAIQLATGGVQKYRGRNIVMPYGYESSQFKDGLSRRVEDLVGAGRLGPEWTKDKLMSLPLQAVGDGKYAFVVGDGILVARPAHSKPVLQNADGSISTERTITIEADGRHFIVPTIVGGKAYSEDQAIELWRSGTNKAVGEFATAEEANRVAKERTESLGRSLQHQPVVIDFNTSAAFRTSGNGLRATVESPTIEELKQGIANVSGRKVKNQTPSGKVEPSVTSVRG